MLLLHACALRVAGSAAATTGCHQPYNPQALHAALVRAAPQFKGWEQHDSQEALHVLLDALQVCGMIPHVPCAHDARTMLDHDVAR